MIELRCLNKKHGEIATDHVIEVKCDSRFCGAGNGQIILHRFHVITGALLGTSSYRDPKKKGKTNASD